MLPFVLLYKLPPPGCSCMFPLLILAKLNLLSLILIWTLAWLYNRLEVIVTYQTNISASSTGKEIHDLQYKIKRKNNMNEIHCC
uniref:Uncharacterized protein n=1 Tax=Parascaris equorum TaxID=6256 RepID=A0A914R9P3_PAREQ